LLLKLVALLIFVFAVTLVNSQGTAQKTTYYSPVINLAPGTQWDNVFVKVDRPQPGARVAVSAVKFTPIDTLTQLEIPIERVYNHHMFLVQYSPSLNRSEVIAAIGAEGGHTPVILPLPYVVISEADDIYIIGAHLIDLWGIPSGANQSITLQYDMTYYNLPASGNGLFEPVVYETLSVVDTPEGTYDVPGNGGPGSVYVTSAYFQFNQIQSLVYAWGHIHIGSVNVSFVNAYTQEIIAYSYPTYDENGFVIALNRQFPMMQVFPIQQYLLTSVYDNSRAYDGVMGMMLVYWSVQNSDAPRERKVGFRLSDFARKPVSVKRSFVSKK